MNGRDADRKLKLLKHIHIFSDIFVRLFSVFGCISLFHRCYSHRGADSARFGGGERGTSAEKLLL